jgi:hypothetical protein
MPKQIKLRRGTTAQHATFIGAEGEVTMDTSKKTLVVHDGIHAGGFPMALPTSFVVNCGNLVVVDAINGNNATAQRGQMQWPFLTLSAAKAAAVAGDTILVLPGTYSDTNLAKNGVNWHFLPGAIVDFNDPDDLIETAIFDTGPSGANAACTFKVTGHGVFRLTNCCSSVLYSTQFLDNISIECDAIETAADCINSRGHLRLVCPSIITSEYTCLKLLTGCVATCHLGLVQTTSGTGIEVLAATATIFADEIKAGVDAVTFNGEFLDLTAREISSTNAPAVTYSDLAHGICRIRSARLVTGDSSYGVVRIIPGAAKLELVGCQLIGTDVGGVSIYADVATTALLYGESTANKAKHANATLVGSALTVNAALV